MDCECHPSGEGGCSEGDPLWAEGTRWSPNAFEAEQDQAGREDAWTFDSTGQVGEAGAVLA